jgi:hypothetical protein
VSSTDGPSSTERERFLQDWALHLPDDLRAAKATAEAEGRTQDEGRVVAMAGDGVNAAAIEAGTNVFWAFA